MELRGFDDLHGMFTARSEWHDGCPHLENVGAGDQKIGMLHEWDSQ